LTSAGVQLSGAASFAAREGIARWHIGWNRGHAEIFPTGAALHNLVFTFEDGSLCRPLAEAPWIDEAAVAANEGVPAHLALLGGEWPCVPFGTTTADACHHGFGTDNAWHLTRQSEGAAEFAIDYPEDHPIARLERRVAGVEGSTAIDLALTVAVRKDCFLPVGLHPIFRLPDRGQRMRLAVDGFCRGHTFPRIFEPGVSRLAVGAQFASIDAVPLAEGGSADLSRPPANLHEEIVLLEGVNGGITLEYPDDGYAVRLVWDDSDFSSLVVWLSDCGRSSAPWSNRFRGIGIEPVAAFFDDDSLAAHAPFGYVLGRAFSAGQRWTTRYRISALRLDKEQVEGKAK
jgi:galactose mutarotase-like enzyme